MRVTVLLLLLPLAFGHQTMAGQDVPPCEVADIGNGTCDMGCLLEWYDGGDCTRADWCGVVANDGECNLECADTAMNYDSGDCLICPEGLKGNGACNYECLRDERDGGDCICEDWRIGNGECNVECFFEENQWDGGDCTNFAESI